MAVIRLRLAERYVFLKRQYTKLRHSNVSREDKTCLGTIQPENVMEEWNTMSNLFNLPNHQLTTFLKTLF